MTARKITQNNLTDLWCDLEAARNTGDYETARRLEVEYSALCMEFYKQYEPCEEYPTVCTQCKQTFYCSEPLEHLPNWKCPECAGWGGKPLQVDPITDEDLDRIDKEAMEAYKSTKRALKWKRRRK